MDRLLQILSEMTLPFAYDHSAEGEPPSPPFICYLFPGSSSFSADDHVYYKVNEVNVELYCDSKDPVLEAILGAVLNEHGIFYNKIEVRIESGKLYEVLYTFEMEVQSTWAVKSNTT